ncbi:MAG: MBL fold metallo-hydrolase [Acidobacteriota bacterium]|nr:MBL fold metallo-hydrolase [Acidobacteriota bacterium]
MLKKNLIKFVGLCILLASVNVFAISSDSVKTKERTTSKIAEGVYVIRHKDAPDTFPQGNTTVVIGEREALVVDSCYLPSSAREDIAQIKQWTNKPVRYLVNTHWHFDHTLGNGTYWESFTPLTIIAHQETAKSSAGFNPGWFERFPRRAEVFRQFLQTGKDNSGKALTEDEKKDYQNAIAGIETVHAEFKTIVDRTANFTFSDELSVDLGNRQVQIKHLGRGNTAGDTIVYLPQEKILITGDLLVSPVPYLFGGFPVDFSKTLQKMALIDAQTIVPGHGEIFRGESGKVYMKQVTEFIQLIVSDVYAETFRLGAGLQNREKIRETIRNKPEITAWRQKFAGDNKDNQDFFDSTLIGLINAAHSEATNR